MNKPGRWLFPTLLFIAMQGTAQTTKDNAVIPLLVDGSIKKQVVDGLGVNANTRSWNGTELEPALQLLLDTLKATIWRVVVETVEKWEDVNDNNDPFVYNWAYYDSLYETPKFRKVWGMIAYLNQQGITKNLMINFMGYVPKWMGEETINLDKEDEYVEMLTSFFYYAKNKKQLRIGLVSPTNESDWRKEGPKLDPQHYASVMRKLVVRMKLMGMDDIFYVGPDPADMKRGINEYIPELMKDSVIMARMAHFGVHSYGGYYADIDAMLKGSPYPRSDFWVTEWNDWRDGLDDGVLGIYDYKFAAACVNHMLDLLQHGATALMVWEGYDSYYEHHAPSPFSYWGILAYNKQQGTYTARKHLYAISQVSAFIIPGTRQIGNALNTDSVRVLSFYDDAAAKNLVITGINRRKTSVRLSTRLVHVPDIDQFEMYVTDEQVNLQRKPDIRVTRQQATVVIPPDCIFTLKAILKK